MPAGSHEARRLQALRAHHLRAPTPVSNPLATRADWNRYRGRLGETFDRTDQLVHQVAQAIFDAVGQRLFGTLLVVSHAQRLNLSMGAGPWGFNSRSDECAAFCCKAV
jgi:broad specificity phosphatase PhoE